MTQNKPTIQTHLTLNDEGVCVLEEKFQLVNGNWVRYARIPHKGVNGHEKQPTIKATYAGQMA